MTGPCPSSPKRKLTRFATQHALFQDTQGQLPANFRNPTVPSLRHLDHVLRWTASLAVISRFIHLLLYFLLRLCNHVQ